MPYEGKCGCKGIRTCLICEKESKDSEKPLQAEEVENVYTFCPHCNLCWSDEDSTTPLFLGKLILLEDFLSEEEQSKIICDIDRIPWVPSQSGRRKQDFGPKVNFKKKKVRIGDFKGFPEFTERIVERIQSVPELCDFEPVELCHLEYSPERGSSIDPHVDDIWLWGERLVTINLASSTVLTLVPFSDSSCQCLQESRYVSQLVTFMDGCCNEHHLCDHMLPKLYVGENSLSYPVVNDFADDCESDTSSDTNNSEQNSEGNECQDTCSESNLHGCGIISDDNILPQAIPESGMSPCSPSGCGTEKNIKTICSLFRTSSCESKAVVRIVLPPRSLFVLAGCARYNWCHEIKRKDVTSRRLAMTFRELTPQFLDGGRESQLGKELLSIASNFINLKQ